MIRTRFGLLLTAAVLVYCIVHAFDPPRLNWGDSGTDYNVMTAGRNFQKYGFLKLHLTPYLLDPAYMTPGDSVLIYTHYPQLPDLANGVERTVFGFSELAQFRLVALGFSFGALLFVYRLISEYWSRRTAEFSLALWVLNPLWIQHADYLHHAPYAFFFGAGSLYFLAAYLRRPNPGRLEFLACGACVFLTFLSSYDLWFLVPILLASMTLAHYRRVDARSTGVLAALAACAFLAIAFKWATNAWALGGLTAWLHDLRFQVTERSTSDAVRTAYKSGIWPTAMGRIERYYSLLMFPVVAFWGAAALVPRLRQVASRPFATRANPLIVLAATLPFLCIFNELWVEQPYPTLWLLPFYAISSGALIALAMEHRSRAPIGVALLAALIWNSLGEDLTFKKAFFDPKAIASLRTDLDSLSVPGQHILVNHVFDGAYRYYFNRFTIAIIATRPSRMANAVDYYSDPRYAASATDQGAIFVQHKHLADEMYDKGFYYLIAPWKLWPLWANPPRYHVLIDSLVTARDAQLEAAVAARGRKVHETDFYTIWRLPPSPAVALRNGR